MKYTFSKESLVEIRSSSSPILNKLVNNCGLLEASSAIVVLDIINEVLNIVDSLSFTNKDVINNILGCIQPLTSLLPACSVVLPDAARNCLIVAFWGNKDKPSLIRSLINESKATVDKFDQAAIDCLREAMRLARMKKEFNLPGNSSLVVPAALNHIINAIKLA